MLSKTELIPARDRLKEAGRHLAYVKGSLKQIKSVEDKRIVNDLVGAIEAQGKAVEQMLQVLDTVARSGYSAPRVEEPERPTLYLRMMTESRNRRMRRHVSDAAHGYVSAPLEEGLEATSQKVA
jgi:hypothetical protein